VIEAESQAVLNTFKQTQWSESASELYQPSDSRLSTTLLPRHCDLVGGVPGYRFRGPKFNSRRYQIFWVVGLERGPLGLVSTIEELLERNSSGSGLEIREYGRRRLLRGWWWPVVPKLSFWPDCSTSPRNYGYHLVDLQKNPPRRSDLFIFPDLSLCLFSISTLNCYITTSCYIHGLLTLILFAEKYRLTRRVRVTSLVWTLTPCRYFPRSLKVSVGIVHLYFPNRRILGFHGDYEEPCLPIYNEV
jgi:hypothetical protein